MVFSYGRFIMTRQKQLDDIKELIQNELDCRVCQNELSADSSLYDMLEGNNLQALKGLYRRLFGYGYDEF